MRILDVSIEIRGEQIHVGSIKGNSPTDAVFTCADSYIESGHPAISISLPVDIMV